MVISDASKHGADTSGNTCVNSTSSMNPEVLSTSRRLTCSKEDAAAALGKETEREDRK